MQGGWVSASPHSLQPHQLQSLPEVSREGGRIQYYQRAEKLKILNLTFPTV